MHMLEKYLKQIDKSQIKNYKKVLKELLIPSYLIAISGLYEFVCISLISKLFKPQIEGGSKFFLFNIAYCFVLKTWLKRLCN